MRNRFTAMLAVLIAAGASLPLVGCKKDEVRARPVETDPLVHGEYLVEGVGQCRDCHTPMGPQGFDMTKHLQGAKLGFAPSAPVPGWIDYAPRIAGLPNGWTKEHMATFLETGKKPGGAEAAPPMPRYRLNPADAKAVAEYLASLKAAEESAP